MNSNTTTAETLATMTDQEFTEFVKAMPSNKVTLDSVTLLGLIVQERIRRHSVACKEYACGFNPVAF